MHIFRFNRRQLASFDEQALNLTYNQSVYQDYIDQTYDLANFKEQIEKKKFSSVERERLVTALKEQYNGIIVNPKVESSINSLLDSTTFTVTTGHQLSLFTGPMYFVIKIMHTVRLAEELKKAYPSNNFVPVYWMATEDHDFEEIQSFEIFNKKFTWESSQVGAVGRFHIKDVEDIKLDLHGLFANHPDSEMHKLIDEFQGETLTVATRRLVNKMFEEYGLVIIDGDDTSLKSFFAPVVKKELEEQFSETSVLATNDCLKKEGVKLQVNPRKINLFYLEGSLRSRIEQKENAFFIEGKGECSHEELLRELEEFPKRFSPNVILRPLYQELILPNLAYVGGLGEISYWLQLKGVFDKMSCTFPMLAVRNSIMWVDPAMSKRLDKLSLHLEDTFLDIDKLKKAYLLEHAEADLDFTVLDQLIYQLSNEMLSIISAVDPAKKTFAEAEQARFQKQLNSYKDRVIRFSKAKNEDAMKQLETVKDRLFPGNGLQERKVNFFSFCQDGEVSSKINFLHSAIDPFNGDFVVIVE